MIAKSVDEMKWKKGDGLRMNGKNIIIIYWLNCNFFFSFQRVNAYLHLIMKRIITIIHNLEIYT